MEARVPTHNTQIAAALFTLGYPGKCRSVLNEHSGQVDVTWQMALHSVTNPELPDARKLMALFKSGELEQKDPLHPFLEGLRATRNRERLLKWIKAHESICLGKVPGAARTVYFYAPSHAAPAVLGKFPTENFRLVCALGCLGIPLVSHSGTPGNLRFVVTQGSLLPGSVFNAPALARAHAAGTLPADHPISHAVKCLENESRLLAVIQRTRHTLLLRKPGSQRRAFIEQDATDAAFDRVQKFFKI